MGAVGLIDDRLETAGSGPLPPISRQALQIYLELLAKWNRTINLTSLDVPSAETASTEAVDRLIVEPVLAAQICEREAIVGARSIVDLGTGSGSPALPFWACLPGSALTMVESRSRKCAFLREAAREMHAIAPETFVKPAVIDARFEDVLRAHPSIAATADILTLRAVRLDAPTANLIAAILRPGGVVVRFVSDTDDAVVAPLRVVNLWPIGTLGFVQVLVAV